MMPSKLRFAKIAEGVVKKARFTEQQIIEILKLAEAGTKVVDLCVSTASARGRSTSGATSMAGWG
jgi:hypothetical protein